MFSWICPQCGHDVPPSKTECPYCAERTAQLATQPITPPPPQYQAPVSQAPPTWQPPVPPPPPPPVYQQQYPPAQQYPPQQYQQYPPAPPQYAQQHPQHAQQPMAWPPPQHKKAPPAWLVGGGFAVALILVFGGIYYFMSKGDTSSSGSKIGTASAAKAGSASPLQRSIEVAGLRFVAANKGSAVKFVVVNHSTAPVSDLQGTVTLWAGTSRSDEDAIGTFNLNVDMVEAGGSKDMTAPLKTKLKPYEMPDWQNATAEVQISSQ